MRMYNLKALALFLPWSAKLINPAGSPKNVMGCKPEVDLNYAKKTEYIIVTGDTMRITGSHNNSDIPVYRWGIVDSARCERTGILSPVYSTFYSRLQTQPNHHLRLWTSTDGNEFAVLSGKFCILQFNWKYYK